MALYTMRNSVQNYAWGSREMLARLTGRSPAESPEAELWMGSHPKSPSVVAVSGGGEIALDALAAEDPVSVIGSRALALLPPGEVQPGLPYLFKILAARQGLSIQAHPSREQARFGYEREEAAGIPIDAPNRTYRDRNHKPEMIYALEDFWGMRGFRPLGELVEEIGGWVRLIPSELNEVTVAMQAFVEAPDWGRWRAVIDALIGAGERPEKRTPLARSAAKYAEGVRSSRAASDLGRAGGSDRDDRYWWVGELLGQFPDDPGAAAPLYLNLVHLSPGEAMYLDAGLLHAYLYGVGVEIMANSDNVLRSGCTVKYVDGAELLKVLTFEGGGVDILRGETVASGAARRFETPAAEFELLVADQTCELVPHEAPVIMLALGGRVTVSEADRADAPVTIAAGESLFVTASTSAHVLVAPDVGARLFVASIPGGVSTA